MYLDFFKLNEFPFAVSPDPEFLYWSSVHRDVLNAVRIELARGAPLVVLSGEIGAGKSTLIHALLADSDIGARFQVILMRNRIERESDFLRWIITGLDVDSGKTDDPWVALDAVLKGIEATGQACLLIIDEAQTLSPDGARVLQRLADRDVAPEVRMRIFLAGQPELADLLDAPEYGPLKALGPSSLHLGPLPRGATAHYIRARLRQAGSDEQIFDDAAASLIASKTGNIPRLINKLCDLFLFLAALEQRRTIDAGFARRMLHENIDPETLALTLDTMSGSALEPLLESAPGSPEAEPASFPVPLVPERSTHPSATPDHPEPARRRTRVWPMGLAACVGAAAALLAYPPSRVEVLSLAGIPSSLEDVETPDTREGAPQDRTVALQPERPSGFEAGDTLAEEIADEPPAATAIGETSRGAPMVVFDDTLDPPDAVENPAPDLPVADPAPPSEDAEIYFARAIEQGESTAMAVQYARAALRGHGTAALYLGQLFDTGDGVAFSPEMARRWYAVSQDTGDLQLSTPESRTVADPRARPLAGVRRGASVDLVWDGVAGMFHLEFADDTRTPIARFDTPLSAARLTLAPEAAFWRVRADDTAASEWSWIE